MVAMYFCDLTLPSAEENLSLDEVLLEWAERGETSELLRIWEPTEHFVVLGYGNKAASEVNLAYCQKHNIPVLRRCTGGGTVLQGPGCLNYSLILRISDCGPLETISGTNAFILKQHQTAFSALLKASVELAGQTDLAIGGLKFSGNAQRRKKHFLIFHGTLLLNLDISLVERTLPIPSRQPKYRADRSHADFLMNLKVPPAMVKSALVNVWGAFKPLPGIPFEEIDTLTRSKYGNPSWNFRL
jgi:lipoate---protein ligase